MKHIFSAVFKKSKSAPATVKVRDGAHSISMDFEDHLLISSFDIDSFSESWVKKERERSKVYFYEKIKEA